MSDLKSKFFDNEASLPPAKTPMGNLPDGKSRYVSICRKAVRVLQKPLAVLERHYNQLSFDSISSGFNLKKQDIEEKFSKTTSMKLFSLFYDKKGIIASKSLEG
uniref:Uncharacterized protein n=1 Tax=Romanomermis culicivorax TaxID=13658 RepID=A0A915JP81_ROMCU